MKSHCCYDAIPTSSKLVIFDTTLQVCFYKFPHFDSKMTVCKNYMTIWGCSSWKAFVVVRWRRPSLHWWLMVWGQHHCGTTSLSVLWVSHKTSLNLSIRVCFMKHLKYAYIFIICTCDLHWVPTQGCGFRFPFCGQVVSNDPGPVYVLTFRGKQVNNN